MTSSPPPLRPRLTIPTAAHLAEMDKEATTTPASALLISPASMPSPNVHRVFDYKSGHWSYIVADPVTEDAAIINPILDFDPETNRISTRLADCILAIVEREGYRVTHILETGIHTRHISSCRYLRDELSRATGWAPRVCISRNLDQTRNSLSPVSPVSGRLSHQRQFSVEDRAFDRLFADAEKFRIGNIVSEVVYLSTNPALSPAALSEIVGYLIGQNVFTSIPGGLESLQEDSMRRLLSDSPNHRVYGVPLKVSRLSQAFITVEQLYQQLFNESPDSERPPSLMTEPKAAIQLYATKINARGGRIPKKITLEAPDRDVIGKQKEVIPKPLLVPRSLASLMCG